MRKLLLLFVCALVSIGVWAQTYYTTLTDTKGSEKVARITLQQGGVLADALASIDNLDQYQYIHISSPGTGATQISLTADDITALSNLNAKTIEMQKMNVTEAFTFTNNYVQYVILPDNWTKAEVKAAGQALSTSANFDAALSMSAGDASFNLTGGANEPSLTAYVNHAGTLRDALLHNYWDQQDYKTIGQNGNCGKLKKLFAMGNISAKDISRGGVYDENGHYVTNGVPDENSRSFNRSTSGGSYYQGVTDDGQLVTGAADGAIYANYGLTVIDLSDAYVPDEYSADITIAYNGIVATDLREVWVPTDSRFKTIPADFLYTNSNYLHQLCIPGNIEYIKTRAFYLEGCSINYIWTTGPDGNTKYDNGAAFVSGTGDNAVTTIKYIDPNHDEDDEEWVAFDNPNDYNKFQYGTFTLPANLRLIERFAFSGCTSVSDVYVLNVHAPECHVDAFSTNMYDANNTITKGPVNGIITRDSYGQGGGYKLMTILRYPKETTDPDIQRYTDPTRDYSIATGERDDKGNMIYFPNHSEVSYAYLQGSYGYVWKAWNDDRNWYDQSLKLGYGSDWPLDKPSHVADYGTSKQSAANDLWTNNTNSGKDDRSFYDVTRGNNNQPGEATAPSGLAPFYNTEYAGFQLYPQPVSVQSNYVYVRDDNGDYVKDIADANLFRAYTGSADDNLERYSIKQTVVTDGQGNPVFDDCTDGNYVQDYEWVEDAGGDFVKESVLDGYTSTSVLVDGVDTYYFDAEGTTAVTPQVGSDMYVECGTENEYTQINVNSEAPTTRTEYYTTSDGGQNYSLTNLQFSGNPHFYYRTGNTFTKYSAANKLQFGKAHYYSDATGATEVTPTLTIPNGGTLYYKDSDGTYKQTNVFVPGQGDYYIEWNYSPGNYSQVNDSYPVVNFNGTYYYEDGTEYEYIDANEYIPGTTYYTVNNNSYYEQTSFDWYMFSGTYYYISGSHPAYCSAQGEYYNANTTYYSDQNGTLATTIRLNDFYYIPTYKDVYHTAETGDEGLQHYRKNYLGTYHLATAADAGEDTYCMRTEDYVSATPITYTVENDYRGWHQFVLTAYAANTIVPYEYLRSFITDNDWWTICEPYDMRYSDMVMFFGTDRLGFEKKIPYLSKLTYVIRDVEKGKITLMFSKNLMEYKEHMPRTSESDPVISLDAYNKANPTAKLKHGIISDEIMWTAEELANEDPIILHAGVPYLIKPNMSFIEGTSKYNRQFSIAKRDNPDLFARLKAAEELPGDEQMEMVYDGEYTVPSYVVGSGAEGALAEGTISAGTKSISNSDGSSFTYKDTDNGGEQITYGGKKVDYKLSNDYTYTFVGTFYRSVMPQYCYFLGWNPQLNGGQGGAAFWYSRVQDTTGWNWNNETGIIIPNWDKITTESVKKIHEATSISDPARWTITNAQGVSALSPDDFPSAGGAKSYGMEFGATNYFQYDEATGISELKELPLVGKLSIYNTNGVYMGSSLNGLAKGVYIVNGQKYVVK